MVFLDNFVASSPVRNTIATAKVNKSHHTRSFNAYLDYTNGSSGIFCKILLMEISRFKVRSCVEELWMKNKITVR